MSQSHMNNKNRKRGNEHMSYEKEFKEAEEKLFRKGYYVFNMSEPCNDLYEIYDRDSNTVMDYLSEAQVVQLSNIIAKIL